MQNITEFDKILILLPTLNAILNSFSTCCLIAGLIQIRIYKDKIRHKNLMKGALFFSTLFLTSYLFYHYHIGHTSFPGTGWSKTFYLSILIPHIILAVGMVPFILLTFWHAYKENWDAHKKIAKITFPIWLYVSLSGIAVYFMLYHIFALSP